MKLFVLEIFIELIVQSTSLNNSMFVKYKYRRIFVFTFTVPLNSEQFLCSN